MAYVQLGDIEFEAVTGFTDFSKKRETMMVQHERIDGKARLQNTGEKLDEVTLKIKLHFKYSNIPKVILALQDARQNGEILPLVWGNGVFVGDFVITTITESIVQTDGLGNPLIVDVDISLIEAIADDPQAQLEAEARKRAFANVENGVKPRVGEFGSVSEAQKVTVVINDAKVQSTKVNRIASELEKNISGRIQNFALGIISLDKIMKLMLLAQKAINAKNELQERSEKLLTEMRGHVRSINKLKTAFVDENLDDIKNYNKEFQNTAKKVTDKSQDLVALTATRKFI